LLLVVGVGLVVAQAQSAQATPVEVNVTLGGSGGEYTIEMTRTTFPADTPITFNVTNKGKIPHEVVLERAGANDQPLAQNNKEFELEDIAPGATVTATWVITQPGDYQLGCHIAGHYEAGMVKKFTVVAAQAATATPEATSAVTATVAVSPTATVTATSVATATAAVRASATPAGVLPVTGGSGSPPGYLILGGLGLLLIAGGLLLRRRLA
jgi:MYXO-CTERM domain-containing protein